MDLVKYFEQGNQAYAIKGQPRTKLADCLGLLKKDHLSQIAANYGLAGRSKMKKQELVTALPEYILQPDNLRRNLLLSSRREWELFAQLLQQPVLEGAQLVPGDYLFLMGRGLLFSFYVNDQLYYLAPEDIQESCRAFDQAELHQTRERHMLVTDYMKAVVNLYGICKRNKLVQIFNSQNSEALTHEELDEICKLHLGRQQDYDCYEDNLISNYFEEGQEEELEELQHQAQDKPFYIPEREELLRYADSLYDERTLQLERLTTHIKKRIIPDQELAEVIADDLQLACSMEASLDELLDEFERREIPLTDRQIDDLLPLLAEVRNHTRLWANRGFTPAELGQRYGKPAAPASQSAPSNVLNVNFQQRVTTAPKVGRNDPCPCGSGKKHKKCCGAAEKN